MKMRIIFRFFVGLLVLQMVALVRADVPPVVANIKPVHTIMAGIMQGIAASQLLVHISESEAPEDEVLPSTIRGRYILQDQRGNAVRDSDYQDTFQLVTFGYTSCPDICPATLQIISASMKQLGNTGENVQPIFITVDPQRDNVERMKQYVDYFDPRLLGLTGSQAMIDRVSAQFNIRVEKVFAKNGDPDFYTVNHTAGTYLIAPGGQMLKKFAYATTSKEMTEGIKYYLDQL